MKRSFKSLISFFTESWSELKKVRWPSRKELTNYTLIVLGTIVAVAIYFWVLDIGISAVIEAII
ncbi:preprotein translocase subunit SecE [Paenibacillus sp. sgz500958]|uniref:preprotein translocase subunit SecE n=1 Tax=Paenibacillus sp. sgz500958 TaxID=3242475 RepID=UPI0036D3C28D